MTTASKGREQTGRAWILEFPERSTHRQADLYRPAHFGEAGWEVRMLAACASSEGGEAHGSRYGHSSRYQNEDDNTIHRQNATTVGQRTPSAANAGCFGFDQPLLFALARSLALPASRPRGEPSCSTQTPCDGWDKPSIKLALEGRAVSETILFVAPDVRI